MNDIEKQIKEACVIFGLAGELASYELITSGHINTTYKVCMHTDAGEQAYILQKVNTYVFHEPIEVMENISLVTGFIREKYEARGIEHQRNILNYQKTKEGKTYSFFEDDSFWRCCHFIEGSVSYMKTDDEAIVEASGKAFGDFQMYLSDFPVEKLNIVIPHFHNTVNRYEAFRTAIAENAAGRADEVRAEIEEYFAFEEIATKPYRMQRAGELPLRVTHNDTKCSNVLFDEKTSEYLCVIDLDTVMPGLVAFDFGDAIRVAASTGEEDEKDLARVAVDMAKYEAFTRGFVGAVGAHLTETEKKTLSLGAVAMTVECGMRFLTDYLNGDKYFKIHYPDQNLVRAKCHLALAADMVKNLARMQEIVEKYC